LFVVAAQEVGDGPDEGREVWIGHGWGLKNVEGQKPTKNRF
jgi:hypothetical protein